jgi:hypothetical protein
MLTELPDTVYSSVSQENNRWMRGRIDEGRGKIEANEK